MANTTSVDKKPSAISLTRELWQWSKSVLISLAIGIILIMFVVQRATVLGPSMQPSYHNGDQFLIQKLSVLFEGGLTRGDVVTLNANGEEIIKRIIACLLYTSP